uniref:SEA domain-containing protein n=1 Tax=Oryzias latipes TaxID=8090 RepID=A0A3P9M478_ORYLA
MTLRYLPFIFLLGFVAKGMTAANESTPNNTTDEGLLDANSTASYMTTSSSNQFTSNVPSIATDTTVAEHVTGEFKSLTAEMSSEPRTMADTTNITISSQTNYPSIPVTSTTMAVTEPETSHSSTSETTETTSGTHITPTKEVTTIHMTTASRKTETSTGTMMTSANTELSTGLSVTPANTGTSTGTKMTSAITGTSTGTTMTSANTEKSTGTTMTPANTEASTGTSMAYTNTKPYTGTSMAYTNTRTSTGTKMTSANTETSTGTSMAYTNTEASTGTTMTSTNTEASTSTTMTSANTETSTGTSMAFTNTGTSTGTQITHTHAVTTTNTEMNTGTSVTTTNITSRPMTPTSINQSGATSSQIHNTASGQTTETTTTNPTTTFSNTTLTSAATISTVLTISNDPTITVTTIQPTDSTFSTAPTPTVCPAFPCPFGSVCLNGTCQCISGSYLSNGQCVQAQVFPGSLRVTSLTFDVQMSDRTSSKFRETAANITAALRDALKNEPGYIKSDVIQLQAGSVVASVNNIFENTNASEESFKQIIDDAISKSTGLLKNATFESTLLCEQVPVPCEAASTVCTNQNGRAVCSCNEGYISTVFSNTSCKACPSGQTAVGNTCKPCSFGYAGFNCNDSSLLAVVIISVVLGGVLLILVVALLIYCCWGRCSCRRPIFGSSPYNEDLSKSWPADITPIPRATLSWDTAGAIEMTEGGSTNTLVEKNHHSNGLGSQLKQKMWKKVRPCFAPR